MISEKQEKLIFPMKKLTKSRKENNDCDPDVISWEQEDISESEEMETSEISDLRAGEGEIFACFTFQTS